MGKELELAIKIGGRLDKSLGTAVNNAQKQLNLIGNTANNIGMAVTAGVVTAGTKLVVDSVNTYKDYQSALNSAAATGSIEVGTDAYKALDAAAREAGRTTVKTAEESANALEFMALAGWSVEESTKALMPVLKLSAATNMDLAAASDLVTDSMSAYGIGIDGLSHYLDVLSSANNTANYSAQQLLESFISSAGMLRTLNVDVEDGAALLGVLANRGIKASEAGTALNAILINMQGISPKSQAAKAMSELGASMFDAEGKTRNLLEVFQDIADVTADMSEEERNMIYGMIGGKSHVDAFTNLMMGFRDETAAGTKEVYALAEAFRNSEGTLDKLYNIKTDTLEGSIATLNSAFDDMKISVGEQIAPILNGAVKNLTAKMPEIEKIIIRAFDKIVPIASNFLDYVIDNVDTIIDRTIKITALFASIKIGAGAINGINAFITLGKNFAVIAKAAGAAKTAAGAFSAFTGTAPAIVTAIPAIAGVTGALAVLAITAKKTYDAMHPEYNFANGMGVIADKVHEASNELIKYQDLAEEVSDLRLVINNPLSTRQEIEDAHTRLQEIAELVGEEYNLKINADTESLKTVLDMVQQLSRTELISGSSKIIDKAFSGAEQYRKNVSNIEQYTAQKEAQSELQTKYINYNAHSENLVRGYKEGRISKDDYVSGMNTLYEEVKNAGLLENMPKTYQQGLNDSNMEYFSMQLNKEANEAGNTVEKLTKDINKNQQQIDEYNKAEQTFRDLSSALANDLRLGESLNAETDIAQLTELGKAFTQAGKDTDEFARMFALSKQGLTDFNEAAAAGTAEKMAQEFMDFKMSIDGSQAGIESAVRGAALIKNGFQDAGGAAAAGGEAINAVLNDMITLGSQQGLFEGMIPDEILDKVSLMANELGLIPEDMMIVINAEGDFEAVKTDLHEIGENNIDVSVKANGDIEIIDRANNIMGSLEGLGAVSLQLNADGDIEILNTAKDVIATIDRENADINIDGNVTNLADLQAAGEAAALLEDKDVSQIVEGDYPGKEQIEEALKAQEALVGKDINLIARGSFPDSDKIKTALEYQQRLENKTVIYKVKYETVGKPEENARGNMNFAGGLTYLNDQNIADPREVIEYGDRRWFYEGRNVLANVPQGARIYNAAQSRQFINGSHRNGLERVPFDGYIAELHEGEQVLTADEAADYSEKGLFAQAIERLRETFSGGKQKLQEDNSSGGDKFVFAPQISVNGDTDKQTIREALKLSYKDFAEYMERYERDKRRKAF